MAKRTIASVRLGTAAVIALGWLACAFSDAPSDRVSAEGPARIPEGQRAPDPAPEDAISVASLSGGGLLLAGLEVDRSAAIEPGVGGGKAASIAVAEADRELPAEILSYLSEGLSDDLGSLELSPSGETRPGVPISMTSDTSLLGDEFDFPTPSLAPPAAPAFD
jgi:hypothetical protein